MILGDPCAPSQKGSGGMIALIVPSVADAERELAGEQDALAEARLTASTADAALTEAPNRLAEAPTDQNAEAVETARRAAAMAAELVTARERRVEAAERQVAAARRVADQEELVQVEREASAHLAELPQLFGELTEIHRLAAEAADRIEAAAGRHAEAHDRARVLAARLGVSCPVRPVSLEVIRTACGLHLADQIGVPETEPEELRGNVGLALAVRELGSVRLDAADLVPAAERLMAELDAAVGATAARWLEPLRDASWNAHESERERFDQAERLLAELGGDANGG